MDGLGYETNISYLREDIPTMKYKAVVFDLDGTLYDNSVLRLMVPLYNIRHIRLVLAERSARKKMSGLWKGSKDEVFHSLFSIISSQTGISSEEVAKWYTDSYMPSFESIVGKFCRKRYWVDRTLENLKNNGIKTVCFSDYDFVEKKLKALHIDPGAFDLIIDAAEAGGLKPCRESFAALADMLGIDAGDILVIGDRKDTDGAGASASGMHFLKIPENTDTVMNL